LGHKGVNFGATTHIQKPIRTKTKARMEVAIHASIKHKTISIE
jgi:hypothetical protein